MTGPAGSPVTLTKAPVENGYGDNTIVWTPSGIVTNSTYDQNYTVQISNVIVDGTPQTYSYTVTICQPTHPPPCPAGKTWSETYCGCMTTTGIEDADQENISLTIRNPISETLEIKAIIKTKKDSKLSVINYHGQTVFESPVCLEPGENNLSINSAGWEKGIYFVIISDPGGKSIVRKVLRQ